MVQGGIYTLSFCIQEKKRHSTHLTLRNEFKKKIISVGIYMYTHRPYK